MAASPLGRSLLTLLCFALLLAICTANHQRRQNMNNCAELLTGQATSFATKLDPQTTPAYQIYNTISNGDHCALWACSAGEIGCPRSAVGSLIQACDYFDILPPSITSVDIFTQIVQCRGPCSDGLIVSVTQFCNY